MTNSKFYYKVVKNALPIGTTIDTKNCIEKSRVERNNQLRNYFELVYNYSEKYEFPVLDILNDKLPHFFKSIKYVVKDNKYYKSARVLRYERKKCNFFVFYDYVYFTDFILDKVRFIIQEEMKIKLPDRFESCFFFETYEDCKKYYYNYNHIVGLKIIEVEFIEENLLEKFDNNFISEFPSYFTSKHYINQANNYLYSRMSDFPHIEIVFQGKYKIISHIL